MATELNININTISAESFSNDLEELYNETMPKRLITPGRKSAYRWNEKIAQLRVDCNKARRLYTQSIRKEKKE